MADQHPAAPEDGAQQITEALALIVETPGLLNGLVGIGYALLRLAEPERVPLILALEAPRCP